MTRIVVGIDGSPEAAEALRWGVAEAGVRHADLVAVLAWGYLSQYPSDTFDADYTEADALAVLDRFVVEALGAGDAARVERRAVCELPAPALLGSVAPGDILIVGGRGLGGFRGLVLGSVSQHCLHHATVPTVVVRDVPRDPHGRVVVGFDRSPNADVALAWALEEARLRGSALTVVHAYAPALVGGPFSAMASGGARMQEAADAVLDAALSAIDTSEVDVTALTMRGSPAGALVEEGEGADLVVVGSRGLGAAKRLLLGSVATQVVHHARLPVAVVPAPHL